MSKTLKILIYPHSSLRKKADEVEQVYFEGFQAELLEKIDLLTNTLIEIDRGAGLSANQVGISWRMFVVNPHALRIAPEEVKQAFSHGNEVVNPKIIRSSVEKEKVSEGCLSFPGISAVVERAKEVEVEFLTREGERRSLVATGFWAQLFQHEIDHLDGKLFVDYLSHKDKFKIRSLLVHAR